MCRTGIRYNTKKCDGEQQKHRAQGKRAGQRHQLVHVVAMQQALPSQQPGQQAVGQATSRLV
jgi:hypothetical protein